MFSPVLRCSGYLQDCCGLTWQPAQHHTVVFSLPPSSEMMERIESLVRDKNNSLTEKWKIKKYNSNDNFVCTHTYMYIITKQVIHKAVGHYLEPVPEQWLTPSQRISQCCILFLHNIMWYGMSLWPLCGWFYPLPVPCSTHVITSRTLQEAERLEHPWLCATLLITTET